MTVKASRALKAALAIGAVAVLSLSLVAMSACSSSEVKGHATKNVYAEPTASVTPADCDGTLDAVSYINYTLAQKDSWHCVKQTSSSAIGTTVTTTTYKDYRDNVLVAEELVYGTGFGAGNSMSHQLMFTTYPEEDRSVYVRSGEKPESAEDGPDDITWHDDVEYWSEAYYNTQYGLFMDEISLYVLNEETLLYVYADENDAEETSLASHEVETLADEDGPEDGDSNTGEQNEDEPEDEDEESEDAQTLLSNGCGDVVDNGDGTYSQTFQLDPEMSTYYYSYSMNTHGGYGFPTFTSVDVTFTFNANWEILDVVENDVSSGLTGSTCVTETHYSYDEDDFDETTYAAGIAFFEPYMGTLEMVDIAVEDEEADGEGKAGRAEYKQYEKNLTLTVVMAIVVGVVIVLGIILTGVGCSTGGKKKNAQQGEDEEKKN